MKQYQIKITDKVLADMKAIYTYIAVGLKVPDTAIRQYNRIADEIATLSQFSERYTLLESQPEHGLGMLRLLGGNYSAVYVVSEDDVTVLRVLYSASDILSRLRNDKSPQPAARDISNR